MLVTSRDLSRSPAQQGAPTDVFVSSSIAQSLKLATDATRPTAHDYSIWLSSDFTIDLSTIVW
jgi:hypothetical protein